MIVNTFLSGPLQVNCYVGVDKETNKGFIVDPGGINERMDKYIKDENIEIEYIILTHGHGDHIGGVAHCKELYPNLKLVASIKEKELLADPELNESKAFFGEAIVIEADIWVKDNQVLNCGNTELKFLETPGHTKGGMSILSGNILFSGDSLFQQSIGRTDFPGGSYEELKNSIHTKMFVLPDNTNVLPGHMGTTTIGYEKENNPFV